MAKIGDKYVIEIDSHMTRKGGDLYGIKGFRSLVFDENGLRKLEPLQMEIERNEYAHYCQGYADARHVAQIIVNEALKDLDIVFDFEKGTCKMPNCQSNERKSTAWVNMPEAEEVSEKDRIDLMDKNIDRLYEMFDDLEKRVNHHKMLLSNDREDINTLWEKVKS